MHSLKPRIGKFAAHPLFGDQCQYKLSLPSRVYQSHSTSLDIWFTRSRILRSRQSFTVKYCLAQSRPSKRYEVSTRSPPSSFLPNRIVLPVAPFIQCENTP